MYSCAIIADVSGWIRAIYGEDFEVDWNPVDAPEMVHIAGRGGEEAWLRRGDVAMIQICPAKACRVEMEEMGKSLKSLASIGVISKGGG